jgi:hypothetical protein
MTPSELYQYLVDRLGGTNYNLSPEVLRRYLTRAQNHIVDRSSISFRASVPIVTEAGDESFALNDDELIQYTTGCSLKDLKRVSYNQNLSLKKRNVGWIRAARLNQPSNPGDPAFYAFHYERGTPTLEIWPAAKHTVLDACDSFLRLDITERYPSITAEDSSLIAPEYAHECLYLWAAFYIFDDFGDERRFSLSNVNRTGTADQELKSVRAQSIKNASGDGIIRPAS